jgi:hypothetical protein
VDRLHQEIRRAIDEDRIVFSVHADNQLVSRKVPRWQAVSGFSSAEFVAAYPKAKPYPKITMRQILADGTPVIAIWSYVRSIRSAKLVTLFFED